MIGDGSKLDISHIGDSSFNSNFGTMKVKDVLVVLEIKKNSISVSQLSDTIFFDKRPSHGQDNGNGR